MVEDAGSPSFEDAEENVGVAPALGDAHLPPGFAHPSQVEIVPPTHLVDEVPAPEDKEFLACPLHLEIPLEARKLLERPERTTTVNLNFHAADGSLVVGQAHVVYYNTCRGPAKGGIRFSSTVSLEETCLLAELMVWKTALAGIPFGGGKSGICIDPHSLSRQEKISALKEFVHVMRDDLQNGRYVPAPDMGTSESDMAVIFGEPHISESVTGTPVRIGGLPGRREATGRGVATTIR